MRSRGRLLSPVEDSYLHQSTPLINVLYVLTRDVMENVSGDALRPLIPAEGFIVASLSDKYFGYEVYPQTPPNVSMTRLPEKYEALIKWSVPQKSWIFRWINGWVFFAEHRQLIQYHQIVQDEADSCYHARFELTEPMRLVITPYLQKPRNRYEPRG